MGGVELSFNANASTISNIVASHLNTDDNTLNQFAIHYKERFAATLKGFLYHKFSNVEFYVTAGLKTKNIKYRTFLTSSDSKSVTDSPTQSKKKTHITPIIGCGVNIPFKDSWFMRSEYRFEFPNNLSFKTIKRAPFNWHVGCKSIKHNVHQIRIGIGRMF